MSALPTSATIAVLGAGTMGAGIAQVAAAAGHPVILHDALDGAAAKAKDGIARVLGRRVEKGKMAQGDLDALLGRITVAGSLDDFALAALVIEAIVENLHVKQEVFATLEDVCGADVILATNTSSLSVTAIGAALKRPQRLAGMHFFNPAPLMALVEVVSGLATAPEVAATLADTAAAWGKSPVHAKSTPGFIVNRVARPFYAEGLRILEEQGADPATIDAVLREAGGFRMGPFELMDLIGHDVNYAVTNSVRDAYYGDRRFLPSLKQKELVDAGWLGRKTGRGFYDYGPKAEAPAPATAAKADPPVEIVVRGDHPLTPLMKAKGLSFTREPGEGVLWIDNVGLLPSDGRCATEVAMEEDVSNIVVHDLAADWSTATRIAIAAADQAEPHAVTVAAGLFQALGLAVSVIDDIPGMIVTRTVAMLANEAADAVLQGVADPRDVDVAMTKGVNYPKGPLAWAEEIGLERVLTILEHLYLSYTDDRYRASALLRRKIFGGTRFHA